MCPVGSCVCGAAIQGLRGDKCLVGCVGVAVSSHVCRRLVRYRLQVFFVHVNLPNPDSMVGGTGGEELDVGRQQQTGQVVFVSFENPAREEGGGVVVLIHAPDIDVALVDGSVGDRMSKNTGDYLVISCGQ